MLTIGDLIDFVNNLDKKIDKSKRVLPEGCCGHCYTHPTKIYIDDDGDVILE